MGQSTPTACDYCLYSDTWTITNTNTYQLKNIASYPTATKAIIQLQSGDIRFRNKGAATTTAGFLVEVENTFIELGTYATNTISEALTEVSVCSPSGSAVLFIELFTKE